MATITITLSVAQWELIHGLVDATLRGLDPVLSPEEVADADAITYAVAIALEDAETDE